MGSRKQQPTRASALVLTVPGLGPIVRSQAARAGMRPGVVEFDGRSDLIAVTARSWAAIGALRTTEDVLANIGSGPIQRTARATVAQLDLRRVSETIESLRALRLVPSGRAVRVVARMTAERHFRRTALRDELQRRLLTRPDRNDRQAVELWAIQVRNQLRFGVRLPGIGRRDQPARPADRPGSLRPAVAAAMLTLVDGAQAIVDPTCGTGTILLEAAAAGALAFGGDRDPAALALARTNGCSNLIQLDARNLPFSAGALDAVVANLPFGHQHHVQGAPVAWYRRALTEALRVAPRAVVLAPASTPFHQALGRLHVDIQERHDIHLLGRRATIWTLTR